MTSLVAFPVLILVIGLQSAVVSRITLLSGSADLMLVILAAWALQKSVDTAWHWAGLGAVLVGLVSHLPWIVPMTVYLLEVSLAQVLRHRVWQAPLLGMFTIVFFATLLSHSLSLFVLRLLGDPLPIMDSFSFITLPSILLNLLLSIPVFVLMRDFAYWIYPSREEV